MRLKSVHGPHTVVVSRDVKVGRSASCDLVLPGHHTSRLHAFLYVEDGRWFVEDALSTNGTLVNGSPVLRCPLETGDVVKFGVHTFEVEC